MHPHYQADLWDETVKRLAEQDGMGFSVLSQQLADRICLLAWQILLQNW